MDRPTKVRIGPLDYEVRWESSSWRRSADAVAQCDNEFQIITIYADITPSQLPCSFVHEVAHGLLYAARMQKDIDEEDVCDTAGYLLTDFWRSNPDVFKWWIGLVK
jgi:hypothetical protein